MFFENKTFKPCLTGAAVAAVLLGVILRFYQLSSSGFFFYDEGLYLTYNLMPLELIRMSPPEGLSASLNALAFYLKTALSSGKAFWFFIIDLRFFFGGVHQWVFAKYAAAILGAVTIPLVYVVAKRIYGSRVIALLSVMIFSLLPGAVFYSRIALQEAFSIFLVLSGVHFYLRADDRKRWIVLSGVLLASAFFSNYRLIMLPVLVASMEAWLSFSGQRSFSTKKFLIFLGSFLVIVFFIGLSFNAANFKWVAAWAFRQSADASVRFSIFNFLSYPFYFFRLETFFFGSFFFASTWLFWKKERLTMLSFILVAVQMFIFSLPGEKGARYIAVVLPFASMSVAFFLVYLWRMFEQKRRAVLVFGALIMFLLMTERSFQLAQASSDHQKAVEYLQSKGTDVKFMSSQHLVDILYVRRLNDVKTVPQSFEKFVEEYNNGARYLVLDPQSYVTLSQEYKFNVRLKDYLSFIDERATPIQVFPHMNDAVFERFVLEHSEQLFQSIGFLSQPRQEYFASIRIYDLKEVIPVMQAVLAQLKQK